MWKWNKISDALIQKIRYTFSFCNLSNVELSESQQCLHDFSSSECYIDVQNSICFHAFALSLSKICCLFAFSFVFSCFMLKGVFIVSLSLFARKNRWNWSNHHKLQTNEWGSVMRVIFSSSSSRSYRKVWCIGLEANWSKENHLSLTTPYFSRSAENVLWCLIWISFYSRNVMT